MKYTSVLDLHTHTVASGHAYCTIHEMAAVAPEKALKFSELQSMRLPCPVPAITFTFIT